MRTLASDTSADAMTLGSADLRDVNRWWTIARCVTNVAHDLRNALQVISGNVEMLQLRSDLDAVTERRLQAIAAQAFRAVDVMDPLLRYARPSSPALQRVDLRALAAVALSFRSVSLGRAGVKTSGIPPNGEPLFVRIDPPAALQLLLNLLLQAECDLSGRPEGTITVTVERAGDVVLTMIEGRAAGERLEETGEPGMTEALSSRVTADLARAWDATLQVDRDSRCSRFTLRVPADVDAG